MASHKIASVAEIVTQPEAHIREILRVLCADNEIRTKASRILSDLENGTQLVPGGSDNGLKRSLNAMQGGVKICVNCDQQFREDDNNDMKCCYHEYELEVDEDSAAWTDWDEKTFGEIDTESNQKEFPHGFKWVCCDKPADERGCVQENHRSRESANESFKEPEVVIKRAKVMDATGDSKKTDPNAMQVCVQCKEMFCERDNRPRSCWHHSGFMDLETSLPVWQTFDWDGEDEIDTDEMREQYPEGFYYVCCGDAGDSKGCTWGMHKSGDGDKAANVGDAIEISDDE